MLTITGLIQYTTVTPLTRIKSPPPKPEKPFTYKCSRPGMTPAEQKRERRAQAKKEGWCGVCTAHRPRPGFKICDFCRK